MFEGGFFSKEETGAGASLARLTGCAACGLGKECTTPKLDPAGRGEKKILIISEIPCDSEDKVGRMFAGEATKYLKQRLADHGINLEKDCRKIAAVSCRTPKGRQPNSNEVEMCRPRVMKEIDKYQPHLILLLGNAAVESVIGTQWKKNLGGINKWRGWTIPDRHFKAWICPLFHPSYVLKATTPKSKTHNPVVEVVFNKDLRRATQLVEKDLPNHMREEAGVRIIDNPRELSKELDGILEWEDVVSLDFETTGLKPDDPVQELISCSLSTCRDSAISFDWPNDGPNFRRLQEIFRANSIKKWAHNAKFEERWAHAFSAPLFGIEWDSMIAAHVLDNRDGVSSLKFQTYVHFGVADYDSHIEPYLKSGDKGARAINTIKLASRKDRLIYNGLDTIFQYRLSEIQMRAIKGGFYR